MPSNLRSNFEIAKRVRELASKREREAARAPRKARQQLSAIASSYRALADELERETRLPEKAVGAPARRSSPPRR